MRTTTDLPDDLHRQAQAIARDTRRSLSERVADLVRRDQGSGHTTAFSTDPRTGQPAVSTAVSGADGHEFWADDSSFADIELDGVIGHRQITDAYLAQLARSHAGSLVTLDSGLAHLHADAAVLISANGAA